MSADIASSVLAILQKSCVEAQEEAKLRILLAGIDFCSLGVYVENYAVVITTDNLLSVGLKDVSLCPVKGSIFGSVVTRGLGFHNNIPSNRNTVPMDSVHGRSKHGILCIACVPVTVKADTLSGTGTEASQRTVGTLTFGSCKADGVSKQHALLAQEAADALAPHFLEATKPMYTSITNYILGPMHGHKPPQSQTPRPLPIPTPLPGTACQDSSDSDSDDEGPSGGAQHVQLSSQPQSQLVHSEGSTVSLQAGRRMLQSSLELSAHSTEQAIIQLQPDRPLPSHVVDSEGLAVEPTAVPSEQIADPSVVQQGLQHDLPQAFAGHAQTSDTQQVLQHPDSSSLQSSPSSQQPAASDLQSGTVNRQFMTAQHDFLQPPAPQVQPEDSASQLPAGQQASLQAAPSSIQDPAVEQTSASHDLDDARPTWRRYADSSNHIINLRAAPHLLLKAAKMLAQLPMLLPKTASDIRQVLSGDDPVPPGTETFSVRKRTSAGKGHSPGDDSKPSKSKGKHLDGYSEEQQPDDDSDDLKDGSCNKGFNESGQDDRLVHKASTYRQHWFLLTFLDRRIERDYRIWQAQHRTAMQLCYALLMITVAMLVAYHTAKADRNPLLWWLPLLQIVPVGALVVNKSWYWQHCEAMHIVLNVLKTIWAVSMFIPCNGELWNSRRCLAVVWKFSMDNLVMSGLGDLARFTIFMPVQALDLAIVTASSGILCKQPAAERGVPWHCMLTMLVSHVLVAYLIDGALVWYMDRQARRKFVLLHALE